MPYRRRRRNHPRGRFEGLLRARGDEEKERKEEKAIDEKHSSTVVNNERRTYIVHVLSERKVDIKEELGCFLKGDYFPLIYGVEYVLHQMNNPEDLRHGGLNEAGFKAIIVAYFLGLRPPDPGEDFLLVSEPKQEPVSGRRRQHPDLVCILMRKGVPVHAFVIELKYLGAMFYEYGKGRARLSKQDKRGRINRALHPKSSRVDRALRLTDGRDLLREIITSGAPITDALFSTRKNEFEDEESTLPYLCYAGQACELARDKEARVFETVVWNKVPLKGSQITHIGIVGFDMWTAVCGEDDQSTGRPIVCCRSVKTEDTRFEEEVDLVQAQRIDADNRAKNKAANETRRIRNAARKAAREAKLRAHKEEEESENEEPVVPTAHRTKRRAIKKSESKEPISKTDEKLQNAQQKRESILGLKKTHGSRWQEQLQIQEATDRSNAEDIAGKTREQRGKRHKIIDRSNAEDIAGKTREQRGKRP
jgi:hypothetical protein